MESLDGIPDGGGEREGEQGNIVSAAKSNSKLNQEQELRYPRNTV